MVENYRPIANLCSASKVFEKLILKQIHYLESTNKLDLTGKQQHGFKCNIFPLRQYLPPIDKGLVLVSMKVKGQITKCYQFLSNSVYTFKPHKMKQTWTNKTWPESECCTLRTTTFIVMRQYQTDMCQGTTFCQIESPFGAISVNSVFICFKLREENHLKKDKMLKLFQFVFHGFHTTPEK